MKNRTRGFTMIEMVLAITILGILTTVSVAPIRDSVVRESVRGARMITASHVARARGAASTRGCGAVLHFGSGGRVWVTSCSITQANAIDTVGTVDNLATRFQVQAVSNKDSVVFEPTGLMIESSMLNVRFSRSSASDSLGVSPIGRLVW